MIRLVYDPELAEADLAQADDGGIEEGDELRTAVIVSLFTDAPAWPDDDVPEGVDRGGWWGDAYPEPGARGPLGSRLWLLQLGPVLPATPTRARLYALEALAWMVADGVASAVEAEATRNGAGRVDIRIEITLTDGTQESYEVPDAV
jgi:phage gp46-like protein